MAMDYEAVIGMEVHAQILTRSKMFCGCSADYASTPPNTHTCPVCLAMPGVLPVINEAAVEATIRTGLALNCEIPEYCKFDRKNYNYPDLPKGYQISQYDLPFCVNGELWVEPSGVEPKRIGIRRVHLEEDTAKLVHIDGQSLIDFNRAGVPLMEIVTEADMRTAEEAWLYVTRLRSVLRYLGVCTGNMEEGAMRCEANISVRPVGTEPFGTKVEVKNINSFRSVRQAIDYEIARQIGVIESGGEVVQVTMGWDESAHKTVFQRSKEAADDYRYFPEPDLPPLFPDRAWVAGLKAAIPELPYAKKQRFQQELGVRAEEAGLLVEDQEIAAYFEETVKASDGAESQTIAIWMTGELFRLLNETSSSINACNVQPAQLGALLKLVADGAISNSAAKEVLTEMFSCGDDPEIIVKRKGLEQISDGNAVATIVRQVLADNPGPVGQFLEGKTQVLGFLVGQVMKATKGSANPHVAREALMQELEKLK